VQRERETDFALLRVRAGVSFGGPSFAKSFDTATVDAAAADAAPTSSAVSSDGVHIVLDKGSPVAAPKGKEERQPLLSEGERSELAALRATVHQIHQHVQHEETGHEPVQSSRRSIRLLVESSVSRFNLTAGAEGRAQVGPAPAASMPAILDEGEPVPRLSTTQSF